MGRDRAAQGFAPSRRTIVELADPGLTRPPVQNPPPLLEWEALHVAAPVGEVVAERPRARPRKVDR